MLLGAGVPALWLIIRHVPSRHQPDFAAILAVFLQARLALTQDYG
jgi:hypothetical protein